MQHSLSEYVDELKKTTASKAAIENELRVAHDIQMSMLPKTFPPYPERNDIDIYGTLTPAKDVGGDLFDFYIRDEKLFFCIGDVSGKGVPASLVMAVTRTLFRNVSAHVSKPDMIVSAINNALAEGNATSMFVTLFIGILDLQTGGLNYCNAGHNSPLIIGRNVSLLPCDPNLPIGIESVWQFSCQNTILEPQSSIFLYTDGLNEAENINHAQFGDQRIMDVAESLAATETAAPTTIVNMMGKAVHSFVGDAEQSDDLTMLSIKYQNQTVVE
jgi:sigma-B regulation protein RsbU (phosphoserine phosphatase)